MKNKKRFMALGLTGAMLMSMGTTAFAAGGYGTDTGKQPVRTYTVGDNVAPDQSADVGIHGEIFDEMNTSEGTKPTDTTGSGDPTKDSEFGGEDTYGNAYLIVTAPTDISFRSAGAAGTDAATLLAGTGTITNQSYYQPNPDTEGTAFPEVKKVKMAAKAELVNDGDDQFTINDTAGNGSDVSGVNLVFSGALEAEAGSTLSAEYKAATLGSYVLKEGTVASDNKTVAPSITKVTFEGTGAGGKVTNRFAADYESGTSLKAESKLNLNFSYIK